MLKIARIIESDFAAATTSPETPEFPKCVKCGHSKASPDDGLCDELLPHVKKEPFGMEMCGCKCEFAEPVTTAPWFDEGGHAWEIQPNVTCVECPHCCFKFAAEHTDGYSEVYSCPNCNGCPDAQREAATTAAAGVAQQIITTVLGFSSLDDLADLAPEHPNRKYVESEVVRIILKHLPAAES